MAKGRRLKSIVESDTFTSQKEALVPDAELYDKLTLGLTFSMAKNPYRFPLIPDTDIRVAKFRRTSTTPALRFYFQVDSGTITLLELRTFESAR